ncbi:hypothetical protein EMCG_09709 [[Emmonsia] crescens]|uniref:BZIP domain-containing protein n=1 Tax=[Emmonsia] crescens TaxID=73230 RepID=A0A0G2I2D2_9EURO|nr:hypothetical protein EMCG_09709 [Emmonsia crescens UAMH 3008]
MFESSEPNSKSEMPLMLPIERSRKEIRREKNRLAQRRHREAKRKSASETHSYDHVHQDQAKDNASSLERRKSQSPDHHAADPMNLDFFKEMGSIPDALEAKRMEKELIDELTNIDSSWEPNFYPENSIQNHPSHTTPETATLPDYLLNAMADDRAHPAMSEINRWRRNSGCSSPFKPAALTTLPNPPLIPLDYLDKDQLPSLSERYHSQQPGFKSVAAATSRPRDLNRGIFHSEDTESHEEHQFNTAMDRPNDFDKSFQPLSQEIITTVAEASGRSNINTCKNKRRRTSYGAGERRLERILSVIEEEGYESLDAVAAEYYIGQFPKDSLLASEQFHSRTRRLGRLLHQVHQSSKGWSKKEAAGYRDIVIRAAEELFQEEVRSRIREPNEVLIHQQQRASPSLSSINSPWMSSHEDPDISGTAAKASQKDTRVSAYAAVRNLLRERDLAPVLMQDVSRLQNTVPETFTLLTELARASRLRRSDQSVSVCLFLQMLGL